MDDSLVYKNEQSHYFHQNLLSSSHYTIVKAGILHCPIIVNIQIWNLQT
jgi:hypothetical protein